MSSVSSVPSFPRPIDSFTDAVQTAAVPRTEFPVDWFDRRSGLTTGQVHQSVLDDKGRLWAATPCGLARYDGVRVKMFTGKDGLNCTGLRAVGFDARGRIWVGSDVGLDIYRLEDGMLVGVQSMPIGMVDSIAVGNRDGWVGTPNGLFRWTERLGLKSAEHPDLQKAIISACIYSPNGILWIAGPDLGIARFDQHNWQFVAVDDWQICGLPSHLANGPDEAILFGGDGGLGLIEADGRLHGAVEADTPVTALHFADGLVWAAFGEILTRFKPAENLFTVVDQVLQGSRINHAVLDNAGNIWVSTENDGLARISSLRHIISRPETADIGAILCVRHTDEGTYLGGTNGAVNANGDVILRGSKVWDISRDGDGMVWAASENGLICLANPTLAIPFVHKSPILMAPCRILHRSGRNLYVGSVRGLVRFSPSGIEEIGTPEGASLGYVYSLFEDASGSLWIGTLGNGLWCLKDGAIKQIVGSTLSRRANVTSVCQSVHGDLFVAHNSRISRIDSKGTLLPFCETADPVSAWAISCLNDNILLAGSGSGLKQFDVTTGELLRTIASAPLGGGWEFTSSRSLALTPDGKILCGTSDGLGCINLAELGQLTQSPAAYLAQVHWHGTDPVTQIDGLRVRLGKWWVDFDLWTDWSIDEKNCEMQHRLLGFSSEWSEPQPLSRISFNSLPSGNYALEVRLISPLCGPGNSAILYSFTVDGAWQSLVLSLSNWLGAKNESKLGWAMAKRWTMSRRSRELEQMIGERTVELKAINEELRSAATALEQLAYTDPLTGIGNRRAFDGALATELERGSMSGGATSLLLVDFDHFKLFNDHYGHGAGDDCLKSVAAAIKALLRNPSDFVARIGGEEFAVVLPDTDQASADCVAERIVTAIRALYIPHAQSPIAQHMTVSVGAATATGQSTVRPAQLFSIADDHLYRAKDAGRDCWSSDHE